MSDIQQGQGLALGITVDPDKDVVVIVVINKDGENIAVALTIDVAMHFGREIRDIAREASALQDELESLDETEIQDRLIAIQQRYWPDS